MATLWESLWGNSFPPERMLLAAYLTSEVGGVLVSPCLKLSKFSSKAPGGLCSLSSGAGVMNLFVGWRPTLQDLHISQPLGPLPKLGHI